MVKAAEEIVVGANGSIYTAPLGTAVPASIAVALGVGWTELGYVSEEGVTWRDGKTHESIRAWQSFYDLRRVVSSREGAAVFQLMQWNADTVPLALGGGSIAEIVADSGNFRYTPPDPEHIDERMLAIEWQDGDSDFRLTFPKGMVSENVETTLARAAAGLLPITFSLLGDEALEPFILDTNHPAFDPA